MGFIELVLDVQAVLKVVFLVLVLIAPTYAALLSVLISLSAILRKLKLPQFNKQYLQQMLIHPYFFPLIQAIIFFSTARRLAIYQLGFFLQTIIAIAEYLNYKKVSEPRIKQIYTTALIRKNEIKTWIATVELYTAITLLGLAFAGFQSFLPSLITFQVMLMRYQIDGFANYAVRCLDQKLSNSIGRMPLIGTLYGYLQKGLKYLVSRSQQQ